MTQDGRPYRLLTFSVDDGHPLDMRVADLLVKFGLTATFYIPARNPEREVMKPNQVRDLSAVFEIGSHTLTHVELTRVPPRAAWNEIYGSKHWVEDTTSRCSIAFCYPRGKHNRSLATMVLQAGFSGARTVMLNRTDMPRNPGLWGVSTQAHSHSPGVQIRHAIRECNVHGFFKYARVHRFTREWDEHFRHSLDWVEKHGGVAHLFLHSWEIELQHDWSRLASALREAASRKHFKCVTNGELFASCDALR